MLAFGAMALPAARLDDDRSVQAGLFLETGMAVVRCP
jgi:hypothetical protein